VRAGFLTSGSAKIRVHPAARPPRLSTAPLMTTALIAPSVSDKQTDGGWKPICENSATGGQRFDSELRLVAALRRAAQERGGPLPSLDVADALLDERRELTGLPRLTRCLRTH
jgi:hypothetical protein